MYKNTIHSYHEYLAIHTGYLSLEALDQEKVNTLLNLINVEPDNEKIFWNAKDL